MMQNKGLIGRALVMGILVFLISPVMVGTVAADNDMTDICRQLAAGNGTTLYGRPGMMGGYGMMGSGGAQMMEAVEVSAMGNNMHDEMQGLVTKMMAGSLSSSDQARMVEIMNTYPGASNMMITRMTGNTGQGWSGYPGMMGGCGAISGAGMMNAGFMSLGVILVVLFFVVWLVVGILLIIWLIRQLRKDTIHA